jgi:hypothetical protein
MTLTSILRSTIGISVMAVATAHAAPDATVSQIMQKTAGAQLVLVGEMHGTREVPALVAGLARGWADAGVAPALVVALEYPESESARLQAYVDSDGGAAAKKRLLATPFWRRDAQDGRSSHAMLALIESVRLQARGGQKVRLAAFDQSAAQVKAGGSRDKDMADNLRAIVAADRSARVIALTGNYHARQKGGAPWNAQYQFMGSYLKDLAPYSLNVDGNGGSYWSCSSGRAVDCKVSSFMRDADTSKPKGLYVDTELAANGYDQALMLDQLTASLPANRAE